MTYNIRPMRESDIDDVYAIETNVHIAPWGRKTLSDCVRVGYNCLVLEVEVEHSWIIAGYIICRHNDRKCHILNLSIAKKLQSQGYGRKFLQHVLDVLIQFKDVDSAVLEVRPSNIAALALYKSLGFKQVEIKHDYYKSNQGNTEDAILLKKELNK